MIQCHRFSLLGDDVFRTITSFVPVPSNDYLSLLLLNKDFHGYATSNVLYRTLHSLFVWFLTENDKQLPTMIGNYDGKNDSYDDNNNDNDNDDDDDEEEEDDEDDDEYRYYLGIQKYFRSINPPFNFKPSILMLPKRQEFLKEKKKIKDLVFSIVRRIDDLQNDETGLMECDGDDNPSIINILFSATLSRFEEYYDEDSEEMKDLLTMMTVIPWNSYIVLKNVKKNKKLIFLATLVKQSQSGEFNNFLDNMKQKGTSLEEVLPYALNAFHKRDFVCFGHNIYRDTHVLEIAAKYMSLESKSVDNDILSTMSPMVLENLEYSFLLSCTKWKFNLWNIQKWSMQEILVIIENIKEHKTSIIEHMNQNYWNDRNFVIDIGKMFGYDLLKEAPAHIRESLLKDETFLFEVIKRKRGCTIIPFAHDSIHQKHPHLIKFALQRYPIILSTCPISLRNDKAIAHEIIRDYPSLYAEFGPLIQEDEEIALQACLLLENNFAKIPPQFKNNVNFLKKLLKKQYSLIHQVDPSVISGDPELSLLLEMLNSFYSVKRHKKRYPKTFDVSSILK